jgi:hypothetical protein
VTKIDVRVYAAMPMTGYDRAHMVKRSRELIAIGAEYGVTVISPVIEENVPEMHGHLHTNDEMQLYTFWKRDKQLIRNRDGKGAHVVLIDRADKKSLGCEREYGLNRFYLWKPTVSLMPNRGYSIARLEDDRIFESERDAFKFIATHYGTHMQRIKWRCALLTRTLPGFVIDQINAWR